MSKLTNLTSRVGRSISRNGSLLATLGIIGLSCLGIKNFVDRNEYKIQGNEAMAQTSENYSGCCATGVLGLGLLGRYLSLRERERGYR